MNRRFGHAGPFDLPARGSCALLASLGHNEADVGQIVWVQNLRAPFVCAGDITQPAVPGQIVHSTDGTRLWRRLPGAAFGSGYWNQRTDWHIDPVAGSFEGSGSVSEPLSSWLELKTRLDGLPLGVGTVVHVHGDLSETIDASGLVAPQSGIVITGEDAAQTLLAGTVQAYTNESLVAPGEAPILTSVAVPDWTPWQGYRLRFASGPALGAITTVSRANPAGSGLNRARLPAPVLCSYTAPSWPVPLAGNDFVIERLPAAAGYVPPVRLTTTPQVIVRGFAFPEVGTTYIEGGQVGLFGCTAGDVRINAFEGRVQGCRFGTAGAISCRMFNGDYYIMSCTMHRAFLDCWRADADHNVYQGGVFLYDGSYTVHHSGAFDSTSAGLTIAAAARVFLFGVLYGSGNATYGVFLPNGICGAYYSSKPVIAGATNSARIQAVDYAWAAIPATGTNLSGIVTP